MEAILNHSVFVAAGSPGGQLPSAHFAEPLYFAPAGSGHEEPYIRDEHRSIATAYFECPGTLDMKVLHLASGQACWRHSLLSTSPVAAANSSEASGGASTSKLLPGSLICCAEVLPMAAWSVPKDNQ